MGNVAESWRATSLVTQSSGWVGGWKKHVGTLSLQHSMHRRWRGATAITNNVLIIDSESTSTQKYKHYNNCTNACESTTYIEIT
jgi:hypothetical protein